MPLLCCVPKTLLFILTVCVNVETAWALISGIPIVHVEPGPYMVEYGQDIKLVCNITSNPPHYNVFWSRVLNGETITMHFSGNITWSPALIALTDVTFEESGQYRCHAQNMIGVAQSNPVNLTVYGGVPHVTIPNSEYNRGYGAHMVLECIIVSTPNHTDVYWQHMSNGTKRHITSSSPNVKYGATVAVPSLHIRRVTTADSGQYTCFAVNSVGTGKSQPTTLTVLGGEILVNSSITKFIEVYGSDVTLQCSVSYKTTIGPVHVSWNKYREGRGSLVHPAFHGNDHITLFNYSLTIPGKDGFMMDHYFLTISALSFSDDGPYQCIASNQFSTEKSPDIDLKVIGDIPHAHLEPGPYNVTYGKNIILQCNISSVPKHFNVYWKSLSNGVNTTWYYKSDKSESLVLLYLDNASSSDTGQYICFAENEHGTGNSKAVNVTIYGDLSYPTVKIESNRYVVTHGESLTMKCLVQTSERIPVTEIYWKYKNNGVITKISEETEGVSGSSIRTPSLTILKVTSSESGTYTCFARNNIGTRQSRPIHVIVTGDVPTVYVKDTRYSIKYGGRVTISCNVTSNPTITNVYWEREFNGTKNVINSWTAGVQGVSFEAPSLTIVKTTTLNNGSYKCIASNNVGIGYSETTTLEVIGELPYISITTDFLQVKYGEKVHISCVVNAIPPANEIYWEKELNGIKYVINTGTTGTEGITVANPSLILIHATDSDAGFYKCFAVNEFGMGYSSAIKLNVIGGLPHVDVPSITHLTGVGYTITLTCSIKNAFPAISRVYWERYIYGSITRLSSDSIGIMGVTVDNPSLIIPMAMESMTGEYTCLAVNSVGTGRSFPAKLTVKAGVTPETNSDDSDDDADYTDTVVKGIIGAVSAVAGVGSLVIAYLAYKRSKKQEDKKGKKYQTASNDSRNTSNKNTERTVNGSKKKTSSC